MRRLGLEREVVDQDVYESSVRRFREAGIVMPTFAQLADPRSMPADLLERRRRRPTPTRPTRATSSARTGTTTSARRMPVPLPAHVVLPPELTGVPSPIVVLLGDRFPMIHSHKLIAAYGCLAPRIVTGQFDPATQRAVWPSTGNYCRGGVAVSRIMQAPRRGRAAGGHEPGALRLAGRRGSPHPTTSSARPAPSPTSRRSTTSARSSTRTPQTVIFNQFSEFGNHIGHYELTGRAIERVFESAGRRAIDELRLAVFTSATGSAGTIAAGDYLKERYGTRIAAVEALECPTLLYNGFGEHNIQGIGDKHVPLIHNAMNTDFVVDITDRATDNLLVLFNTEAGHEHLRERMGVPRGRRRPAAARSASRSICNVLAAIKVAKQQGLGPKDVHRHGGHRRRRHVRLRDRRASWRATIGGTFDAAAAGEVRAAYLDGVGHGRHARVHARGPAAHVQPGLLHLGRAAGRARSRSSRRGESQDFWVETRQIVPRVGRHDRRVQRRGALRDRGLGRPWQPAGLCRLRRARSRPSSPSPGPARRRAPGDDIDHVLQRVLDPAPPMASPTPSPAPTPSCATAAASTAYHVARAAGWSDAALRRPGVTSSTTRSPRSTASGFRATPIVRSTQPRRRSSASRRGRRLGQGRDRQRLGLAQGPPPHGRDAGAARWPSRWAWPIRTRRWPSPPAATPRWRPRWWPARRSAACWCSCHPAPSRRSSPGCASLEAEIEVCERLPGQSGDPTVHRLLEAIADGAVPFTVQGNLNGLAIEGGATLGWELIDQLPDDASALDRLVIHVGGGAFASAAAQALEEAVACGQLAKLPVIDTVQTQGGYPLHAGPRARARSTSGSQPGTPVDPGAAAGAISQAAHHRSDYMWAWETEPVSHRPRHPRRRDVRLARRRACHAPDRRSLGRGRRGHARSRQRPGSTRAGHRRRPHRNRRPGRPYPAHPRRRRPP